MAVFRGFALNLKLIRRFTTLFNHIGVKTNNDNFNLWISNKQKRHEFHTSFKRTDLMEFFDDPKNWGEQDVRTGRPWNKDELRIKSNSDLHKLWFVLYKEKNMLLTMEEECNRECELFPAPERIDKVEESMRNLDKVIQERDRAVHLLETGETGEIPSFKTHSPLGNEYEYRMKEWPIPWVMNRKWCRRYFWYADKKDSEKFVRLMREKKAVHKMYKGFKQEQHTKELLERFPDMDISAIEPIK